MYEIHLVIRGALDDAVRRGLLTRNVALIARSPRIGAITKTEARSWTAEQLQQFLRAAAGHQLFPLLWLTAMTGMRRNEVLGLKWDDIDFKKKTISLNRGLVAVGYELHQTRGKTRNARRRIDLDDTSLTVLAGWKALRAAEFAAVGEYPPVAVDSDGSELGGPERLPSGEHRQGGVVEVDGAAGVAGLTSGLVEFVADGDEPSVERDRLLPEVDVVPFEPENLVAAHPGHRRQPEQREELVPGRGPEELL